MLNKKALSALSVTADPNFKNVTLLLQGDGTNGAQNNTFIDSSTNNFTITRNGNTTQGSLSPFGDRWSNYFDGIYDSLYRSGNSTALRPGSGNFTIEFWFNSAGLTQKSFGTFYEFYGNSAGQNQIISVQYDGTGANLIYVEGGLVKLTTSGVDVRDGAWHHHAIVRNGSTVTYYVDGVNRGTYSTTLNVTTGDSFIIGNFSGGNYEVAGYMSNLRVVVGSAVYTSNFTPPTEPLTAISGTSLLTCQSNRLIDNSSNNFTITRNGDVSVQPFSPFSPSSAYSASVSGGSGYFDGTGDYLETSINNAIIPTTGNFTAEAWVYITSTATDKTIFYLRGNTNTFAALRLGITASTSQVFLLVSTNGSGWQILSGGLTSLSLRTWNHIAVTRNGGTFSVYINGASVYTSNAISAGTALTPGSVNWVGAMNNSGVDQPFLGYISNLRVVNGTSVYTAAFTPPTAPLTAITNTSLLLNFTNAGVVDSAADNVLETVGNAQISTSVKKYGTGSLAFDGTGDYLSLATSPLFGFNSGEFTIEFWLYPTSVTGTQVLVDFRTNVSQAVPEIYLNGTSLIYYLSGADRITATSAISQNTWQHVALVKSGTTTKLYVNGTNVGGSYSDVNTYLSTAPVKIGTYYGGDLVFYTGYIDDLRITKGVARYTSNFTPPAAALPKQ